MRGISLMTRNSQILTHYEYQFLNLETTMTRKLFLHRFSISDNQDATASVTSQRI